MPSPTASESYLAELNEAQREAVTTTEGPLLVVAGAGSGKTRVLTYRVAYLLEQGVKPNEILAITFTNKAAAEMRSRIEAAVGAARPGDLDPHVPRRLRPDPAARGRAARLPVELHDLRPGRPDPPRPQLPRGARARPEALHPARHPHADLEREEPADRPRRVRRAGRELLRPDGRRRLRLYQRRLFALNAVDFDDLLMLTVEVLQRFPEARERWAKAFRYVLVDEYQDTNHAQYVLLQLLAGIARTLWLSAIQISRSIAFRGADIGNILSFERDFPGTQVIPLEQNYRSTNAILNAANAVIENNRERKPKHLWSELGEGDPVRVVETEDEHAEARFVAAEVAALLEYGFEPRRDRGRLSHERAEPRARGRVRPAGRRLPGDRRAAVLRARRDQGRDRLPAGDRQPLRRVSLSRIANKPRRGVGDTSLARLQALADGEGISLWEARRPGRGGRACDGVAQGGAGLADAAAVADGAGAGAVDRGAARGGDRAHGLPRVPARDAAEVGGGGQDREPRGACRGRA